MGGIYGVEVFVAGAVFGTDRTFLVKFAEVEQVVDGVAGFVVGFVGFGGRWQPEGGDAQLGQVAGVIG